MDVGKKSFLPKNKNEMYVFIFMQNNLYTVRKGEIWISVYEFAKKDMVQRSLFMAYFWDICQRPSHYDICRWKAVREVVFCFQVFQDSLLRLF